MYKKRTTTISGQRRRKKENPDVIPCTQKGSKKGMRDARARTLNPS
jgi:hypothetical protein